MVSERLRDTAKVNKAVRAQEWERHDYYVKSWRPAGAMERNSWDR